MIAGKRLVCLFAAAALLPAASAFAQPESVLQKQIREIAADAHGTVSVACSLPGTKLDCDLNPHGHPPMQSVFKLPLGLYILHQVEQGKLSLDQPVRFLPSDRYLPKWYSPLQEKYPEANVDIPLRELLRMAVSLSDNAAADILLRLAGGTKPVDEYIASLGVKGFHLRHSEHELHDAVKAQYDDWFEPVAAVALLRTIGDHSPLTAEHNEMLMGWMRYTARGRLNADLPEGVRVDHKSGTSDVVDGVAFATNDIGLIYLPDGRRVAVAVFLTDSKADEATRFKVIARIGRAVYDAGIAAH